MRLIDADVLKQDLTRFYDNEVTAKQLIDEQPTVYAEPVKQGEWEWSEYASKWICSNCWHTVEEEDANTEYNYCPYCGARMDGVEE